MVTNSGFSLSGSAELPGAVLRHFIAEVRQGKMSNETTCIVSHEAIEIAAPYNLPPFV